MKIKLLENIVTAYKFYYVLIVSFNYFKTHQAERITMNLTDHCSLILSHLKFNVGGWGKKQQQTAKKEHRVVFDVFSLGGLLLRVFQRPLAQKSMRYFLRYVFATEYCKNQ